MFVYEICFALFAELKTVKEFILEPIYPLKVQNVQNGRAFLWQNEVTRGRASPIGLQTDQHNKNMFHSWFLLLDYSEYS